MHISTELTQPIPQTAETVSTHTKQLSIYYWSAQVWRVWGESTCQPCLQYRTLCIQINFNFWAHVHLQDCHWIFKIEKIVEIWAIRRRRRRRSRVPQAKKFMLILNFQGSRSIMKFTSLFASIFWGTSNKDWMSLNKARMLRHFLSPNQKQYG